ncbi:MAG: YdcF family protein, partial [Verrucomicrobiae bacterium]|nr:YdcF family protein [Verrucomicrobiae bacterium]
MYAILSAIASFLVQPVIWITFLLISLALVKSPRWARQLRWTVIAVAIVFTNPWLYHTAMLWWEPPPLTIAELDPPYDDAIVLGGFTRLWATPTDRLHLNGDGNRFAHAIELYRLGKVRRIVFVSGGKTSSQPEIAEADLAARTAARFDIPPEAIVALNTSR